MAPVVNFTLPAVRRVCRLVALGTLSIAFINSAVAVDLESTSPPPVNLQSTPLPLQHQAKPLPDGYVSFPDIGVAYKVHTNKVNFFKARSLCAQEGAKLAVVDFLMKIEYIGRLIPDDYAHTGIIRSENSTWIDIETGSVISSIPWGRSQPSGPGDCLQFSPYSHGLSNFACDDPVAYICELPILPNPAIAAN